MSKNDVTNKTMSSGQKFRYSQASMVEQQELKSSNSGEDGIVSIEEIGKNQ